MRAEAFKGDKSDWKDCGNFTPDPNDTIIRECYACGVDIQVCSNCRNDHHI